MLITIICSSGTGPRMPIFYQGCYRTSSKDSLVQGMVPTRTLPAETGTECQDSCQDYNYPFFSLKKVSLFA